ncbi:MAG: hypothetical protein SNJ72_01030 [Fimbriimonadales bacterium]
MKLQRDWFGRTIAFLTLWLGVGLMLFAFWLAYRMFQVPPQQLMTNPENGAPDLNSIAIGVWASVRGLLLLVLMTIVGGMIANRGIALYMQVRKAEYETMASSREKTRTADEK